MIKNKVVIVPIAGLCNRMRAIASGIYLSKKIGIPISIYWHKKNECLADFTELFQTIKLDDVTIQPLKLSKFYFYPDQKRNLYLPGNIRKAIFKTQIVNFNKNTGNVFDKISTNGGYITTPHSLCQHYSLNEIFKPIDKIKSSISNITDKFSSNVIGIHIRRTDNKQAIDKNSLEDFYNRMDIEIIENPNIKFYLATDSISVKEEMIAKYKEKIISYNASLSRDSVKGMQDAVIDLWCLSSTSFIIGSFYSSYSELAAELGGIKLVIL
jgi:hypothetical protein